jgi:flavin reductase (DIM6/NTAB) family NADH-FMN oxidoreductase RutF
VSFTKGEPEVAEYRRVIGGFATGVAVVTSMLGDEPHGMTINSLTSVSLDPIIVFIALQRGTRTARAVAEHRRFVVNLLDDGQEPLSARFARGGEDHFKDLEFDWSFDGLPVLQGGLGWLSCEVQEAQTVGDHLTIFGRVRRVEYRLGKPLLFFRGKHLSEGRWDAPPHWAELAEDLSALWPA